MNNLNGSRDTSFGTSLLSRATSFGASKHLLTTGQRKFSHIHLRTFKPFYRDIFDIAEVVIYKNLYILLTLFVYAIRASDQ